MPETVTSLDGFLEDFVPASKKDGRQSQDLVSTILTYVRDVTGKVTPSLSDNQAYEVLLFSTLFVFLQCKPKEEDLRLLREYVGVHTTPSSIDPVQEQPASGASSPEKPIQEDTGVEILLSPETLPFFPGCLPQDLPPLALRTICNKTGSRALVKLDGCTLQRHLAPGEKLLVLTAGGKIVTFLPRFCVVRDRVIWQEEDRLESEIGEVSLENNSVHFFAESEYFGLLVADANGSFFDKNCKESARPGFSVRYLGGAVQDYGFLKEDGSYSGFIHREAWKKLLKFDLCAGSGIAITTERHAIDSNGRKLSENAVEISCLGQSYIILRTDGTVVTDQGELEGIPLARAVCVNKHKDNYGYWISSDDGIYFLEKGSRMIQGPLPDVPACEEFQRNNTGSCLYGLNEHLEFQPLR